MFSRILKKNGFTKKEASWILYDVANSAFVLTVITVLFPIYYNLLSEGVDNAKAIIKFTTAGIALVVALISPIIGSLANYKGNKKRFFRIFVTLGIVGGFALAIPGLTWVTLLVVFVMSSIGYNTANVIYDAFIVDVTDEDRMDMVSGYGFGYGYIGSLIPFFVGISVYAMVTLEVLDASWEIPSIAFAFIISCLWWLFYTLPMLRDVEQTYEVEKGEKPVREALARLGGTFRDIKKYKNVVFFLIAYLLYIDVVNTVIRLAIVIGDQLEVGSVIMLGVVIVVQIIAFPFAIIYGKLAKKIGGKRMIFFGILMYALLIIIVSQIVEGREYLMWVVAIVVGTAQGGIQSVSRSYFAKMVPSDKANEFFGFFSVFGRFAGIFSPFLLGMLDVAGVPVRVSILYMLIPLALGSIFLGLSNAKKAHA